MSSAAPEFSRIEAADKIGAAARTLHLEATPDECAALARRFSILSLDHLSGDVSLVREGTALLLTGRLNARLAQACVASGIAVPEHIDVPFALRFIDLDDAAEEIELDANDLDDIAYDGHAIDLGEALAQTLAVSMTPFPRGPDADQRLRAAGVISEEAASPFAALAGLDLQSVKKKKS